MIMPVTILILNFVQSWTEYTDSSFSRLAVFTYHLIPEIRMTLVMLP